MFLENHDGQSWNKLGSNLCAIYAKSKEIQDFSYWPNAISFAASYASTNFIAFTNGNRRFVPVLIKIPLIAYVATEIATDFFNEFEIGNVY